MYNIHTWRHVKGAGYGVTRHPSVKRSKVLSFMPISHWYYNYWYRYQLDCSHTLEGCRSLKFNGSYSQPETISCPVCALVAIRKISFETAFNIWLDHKVLAAKEEIEELTVTAINSLSSCQQLSPVKEKQSWL